MTRGHGGVYFGKINATSKGAHWAPEGAHWAPALALKMVPNVEVVLNNFKLKICDESLGLKSCRAMTKGQHASRRNMTWQMPWSSKIPYVAAQRRYGSRAGIMEVGVRERSHQKMQGM